MIGHDRSQSKLALEGHQVWPHSCLLGLVERNIGGLVVGRDFDRGVTSKVRVALQQHRFAAGGFHAVKESLLKFR